MNKYQRGTPDRFRSKPRGRSQSPMRYNIFLGGNSTNHFFPDTFLWFDTYIMNWDKINTSTWHRKIFISEINLLYNIKSNNVILDRINTDKQKQRKQAYAHNCSSVRVFLSILTHLAQSFFIYFKCTK